MRRCRWWLSPAGRLQRRHSRRIAPWQVGLPEMGSGKRETHPPTGKASMCVSWSAPSWLRSCCPTPCPYSPLAFILPPLLRWSAGSQDGRGFVQCLGLVLQHLGTGTAAHAAAPSASDEGGGTDTAAGPSQLQHQQQHQHMAHSGDSASSLPGGGGLPGSSSAGGTGAGRGPQAPHPRAIAMAEHLLVAARTHRWGELVSLLEVLLGSHAAPRHLAARSGSEASMQTDSSSEDASRRGHGRPPGGGTAEQLGPGAAPKQQQGEGREGAGDGEGSGPDGDASMEDSGMGPCGSALLTQGSAAAALSSTAAAAAVAAAAVVAGQGRPEEGNVVGGQARCNAMGAVERAACSAFPAELPSPSEIHMGGQPEGKAVAAAGASLPRSGSVAGSMWLGGSSSSSSEGSSSKLSSEEDEDVVWLQTPSRVQWLRWMLKQPRGGAQRDATWQGVLWPSTLASVAAVGLATLVMRSFMGAV